MKTLISTPPTEQATQTATKVPVQSRTLSNHHHPYSKADIYASLGEVSMQDCYAQF